MPVCWLRNMVFSAREANKLSSGNGFWRYKPERKPRSPRYVEVMARKQYHWSNERRSKRDSQGNLLPLETKWEAWQFKAPQQNQSQPRDQKSIRQQNPVYIPITLLYLLWSRTKPILCFASGIPYFLLIYILNFVSPDHYFLKQFFTCVLPLHSGLKKFCTRSSFIVFKTENRSH